MSLDWPWALVALLAAPVLVAVRWWWNRRRRKVAVRVSSVAPIKAALPGRTSWRRRIPAALFVLALVLLGTGVARPQASVAVPRSSTSVLLALDVSASMCANDIEPNRLTAAREAAREFVRNRTDGTKIGLVAFSGIAGLLVKPTTDRDALLKALDGLRTARGTAIGLAILTSIDAIAEANPNVPPTGVDLGGGSAAPGLAGYEPDTIVVLTDGANTQGVDPVTAAGEAAARRLRVYTIGFGTNGPAQMVCTRDQISGDAAVRGDGRGFGGGPGGGRYLRLDEDALTQVADVTGGQYFQAQDAARLSEVLTNLPRQIVVQTEEVELTVWFVLVGTLLVLGAIGLSLWWNRSPGVPRRVVT